MKDAPTDTEECTGAQRLEICSGASTRDPQHLLHKLKALHVEAEKEYGLNLFTAFLGEGGTTIETVVNSQDAAIAKVMMDGSAKQRQQAVLDSLHQAVPQLHDSTHERIQQRQHHHQQRQHQQQQQQKQQQQHQPQPQRQQQQESQQHQQQQRQRAPLQENVCAEKQAQPHQHKQQQEPVMKAEEHCKTEEIWKDEEEGSEHDPGDDDGNSEMFSRRPAPPGLGAAALWAREAASLKRKMGAGGVPKDGEAYSSSSTSRRLVAATVPMPSTNKELAELIRDVVGARPKYGDESARPAYWPVDVPWQKGKSISQMNNVTLRRLARAVVQHQARAREKSRLAGGIIVPVGGVGCGRRTKKELSALIRSKLGLRLQYGEIDRRPVFWPRDVPWKKGKPLSMMNHGELSSVFAAMVGAGLCPAGACLDPPHIYEVAGSESGSTQHANSCHNSERNDHCSDHDDNNSHDDGDDDKDDDDDDDDEEDDDDDDDDDDDEEEDDDDDDDDAGCNNMDDSNNDHDVSSNNNNHDRVDGADESMSDGPGVEDNSDQGRHDYDDGSYADSCIYRDNDNTNAKRPSRSDRRTGLTKSNTNTNTTGSHSSTTMSLLSSMLPGNYHRQADQNREQKQPRVPGKRKLKPGQKQERTDYPKDDADQHGFGVNKWQVVGAVMGAESTAVTNGPGAVGVGLGVGIGLADGRNGGDGGGDGGGGENSLLACYVFDEAHEAFRHLEKFERATSGGGQDTATATDDMTTISGNAINTTITTTTDPTDLPGFVGGSSEGGGGIGGMRVSMAGSLASFPSLGSLASLPMSTGSSEGDLQGFAEEAARVADKWRITGVGRQRTSDADLAGLHRHHSLQQHAKAYSNGLEDRDRTASTSAASFAPPAAPAVPAASTVGSSRANGHSVAASEATPMVGSDRAKNRVTAMPGAGSIVSGSAAYFCASDVSAVIVSGSRGATSVGVGACVDGVIDGVGGFMGDEVRLEQQECLSGLTQGMMW